MRTSRPANPTASTDLPIKRLPAAWRLLDRTTLLPPPETVAPRLLNTILARRTAGGWLAGRIVEVEAYLGPHITDTPDPAAHSFRGITDRNRVMFGPPGHAYVYFIYGMYFCVNITCETEGLAGCILVRALQPLLGRSAMATNRGLPATVADAALTGGPGRLTGALEITRPEHNGVDLLDVVDSPLQLLRDTSSTEAFEVESSPRIGIRRAAQLPLRFAIAGNPCVSRPRPLRPLRGVSAAV